MARLMLSVLRLAGLPAGVIVLLSLAPPAAAAPPVLLDQGRLTISKDGQPVRVEDFLFERRNDSLVVRAASRPWSEGPTHKPPDKSMTLIAGALDFSLSGYWSTRVDQDTLRRRIAVSRGDTVFTTWRDVNGGGTGDAFAMPPGRLYVLDTNPPLFTLFGVIGWTMRDKECAHRPIRMMVLGARDTLVDAAVTDTGKDRLTWHGQPVKARQLLIADKAGAVEAWFTPDGHLLRLDVPQGGVRAERDATPAEPKPARREESAPRR